MALTITQGPLPNDGESVQPHIFLEDWINNTVITDLDATNFDTSSEGGVSFVISSTNPPASSARTAGMYWFERGAGKMWVWDRLDGPSQLTQAADFGRYQNGFDWACISGGKETWLLAHKDIPKGAMCYIARQDLNWITTYSNSTYLFFDPDDTARRGHSPNPSRFYWFVTDQPNTASGTAEITEICWVALDTAASGALFRGKEFGWCNALAQAGVTTAGAYAYVTDSGVSESSFLQAGAWITQSTNPGRMFVAVFTETEATNDATQAWLRSAFKIHLPPWGIARERV